MEKPTPSTLLVLGVLAFPTVAFPALFLPILLVWIGWKLYSRRTNRPTRDVRQSIHERELRQARREVEAILAEAAKLQFGEHIRAEITGTGTPRMRRIPRARP